MKILKIFTLLILSSIVHLASAQEIPTEVASALQNDDATKLATYVTKDNINNCYSNYSLLSEAIRNDAKQCFELLITKSADVNKSCKGYVPPLMHAAKYGHLDMVKILVAKGANTKYVYDGTLKLTNGPEKGETPLSYAQKYERDDIADYLLAVKTYK